MSDGANCPGWPSVLPVKEGDFGTSSARKGVEVSMRPVFNKIAWAVDPLGDKELFSQSLLSLGALTRVTQAKIQPVFVLSPAHARLPLAPFRQEEEAFRALAEKEFKELVKNCDLCNLDPLTVLVNNEHSVNRDIELLLKHVHGLGVDLIVTSTHGRRGIPRLVLGSFVEALMTRSQIPVFTVNPEAKIREKIRRILFPTIFTHTFQKTFEQALVFAKDLDADLALYYKEPDISPVFVTPDIQDYFKRETSKRNELAQSWLAKGREHGVRLELLIDDKPGIIPEAIVKIAEDRNFDLIMMGSQADPVSAVLMGSVSRATVRRASCPVCVLKV